MKAHKDKSAMGRPRKEIDFAKVDALCEYHCTPKEIVAHLQIFDFDVSYDTVERRVKEKFGGTFADYVTKKHFAYAKPTLRRLQWNAAESGNVSMLIWLGKQYLGQADNPHQPNELKPMPITDYRESKSTNTESN